MSRQCSWNDTEPQARDIGKHTTGEAAKSHYLWPMCIISESTHLDLFAGAKNLCECWPQDNMCHVCRTKGVSLVRKGKMGLLLAVNPYLIARSIFWAGLGFSGRGWLWGPVRVHAEFLGQMHVSSLGCHPTPTAEPGQTLASRVVDAPLEITKPQNSN